MSGYSLRLPGDLIGLIDAQIHIEHNYTTRPDFLMDAIRQTIVLAVSNYQRACDLTNSGDERFSSLKGHEKEIIAQISNGLLDGFRRFGGDPVQVMFRIPEGLSETISRLQERIGYGTSKLEFIQIAIVCQLANLDAVRRMLADKENYVKEMDEEYQKMLQDAVSSVISGNTTNIIGRTVSGLVGHR